MSALDYHFQLLLHIFNSLLPSLDDTVLLRNKTDEYCKLYIAQSLHFLSKRVASRQIHDGNRVTFAEVASHDVLDIHVKQRL